MKLPALPLSLLLIIALLPLSATGAEYQLRKPLSSLKGGSYYASKAVGDGVVQVTECRPFRGDTLGKLKGAFHCAPDRAGFRCTSDATLDVIFVFQNRRDCTADRKHTLETEDQE